MDSRFFLKQWTPALAVGAVCLVLLFFRLGSAPLFDFDEATYAQITHEMLTRGHFLSFTYLGRPFLEKPPLLFWLAGISSAVFDESEAALRLPSALAGAGLVAVVILFAYALTRRPRAGALAGAILAGTAPFVVAARQLRFDILVSFFIMLACYCFYRGLADRRWFLAFWAAAALAVLSKSVIAVFIFVFVLLFAALERRFAWLRDPFWWAGFGLFLAIALPWHLWELARWGAAFWNQYVVFTVVARYENNLFMNSYSDWEYLRHLALAWLPWSAAFLGAVLSLPLAAAAMEPRRRAAYLASLGTVAAILAVFFFSQTKAQTYLLPLYPFGALALALWMELLLGRTHGARALGTAAACLLIVLGVGWSAWDAFVFTPQRPSAAAAREEKIAGEVIARAPGRTLWVYRWDMLGSIMYYSADTRPLKLLPDSFPAPGSLLVLPTGARVQFSHDYPRMRLQILFPGHLLTIAEIAP